MSDTVTDTTPTEAEARTAYAEGLRSLADWLEAHPEVPLPFPRVNIHSDKYAAGSGVAEASTVARAMGTCEKGGDDNHFHLSRRFGPVELCWAAWRAAVCERRTVTKEVVEWVCPPLLAEGDEATVGAA